MPFWFSLLLQLCVSKVMKDNTCNAMFTVLPIFVLDIFVCLFCTNIVCSIMELYANAIQVRTLSSPKSRLNPPFIHKEMIVPSPIFQLLPIVWCVINLNWHLIKDFWFRNFPWSFGIFVNVSPLPFKFCQTTYLYAMIYGNSLS